MITSGNAEKVRYFIVPLEQRWTIRRASRRIGTFADQAQAITVAVELATVGRGHGQVVEVLKQDADGRWEYLVHAQSDTIN